MSDSDNPFCPIEEAIDERAVLDTLSVKGRRRAEGASHITRGSKASAAKMVMKMLRAGNGVPEWSKARTE